MQLTFLFTLVLLVLPLKTQAQADSLSVQGDFFKTYYLVNDKVVKKKEFRRILKSDEEARQLWKRGSWFDAASGFFAFTGIALLASTQNNNPDNPPYWWQWAGGLGGTGAAFAFAFPANKCKVMAIEAYNRNAAIQSSD
ncbi:MAG: hypothetical protein Crog4KO_20130 [Crocinitomicaceae bacterium]